MGTVQWRKDKSGKLILQEYRPYRTEGEIGTDYWVDVPIVNEPPKTLREKMMDYWMYHSALGDSFWKEQVSIVREHMLELYESERCGKIGGTPVLDVIKSIE